MLYKEDLLSGLLSIGIGKVSLLSGSVTGPALGLDTEGLLSSSARRASSRARQRRPLPKLNTECFFRLGTEGFLSGSAREASLRAQHRGLPLVSAERTFSQAQHRGPAPRLDAESLLSGSAQRASSRARHRAPPLGLSREALLSGSTQRASSRAQQKGSPLGFGAKGLFSDSAKGASSIIFA